MCDNLIDVFVCGVQGFKHPEMFNTVATLVVETADELQLSEVCITLFPPLWLFKDANSVHRLLSCTACLELLTS